MATVEVEAATPEEAQAQVEAIEGDLNFVNTE
jgi:hypothetical protein